MSKSGVTQSASSGGGGGGTVIGAQNGLTLVGAGTIIELGGPLLHDTFITNILPAIFKLILQDVPFAITGTGPNPVLGAGSRLAYSNNDHTLYFGQATGTDFDTLPTFSLVGGTGLTPSGILGFFSIILGTSSTYSGVRFSLLLPTGSLITACLLSLATVNASNGINLNRSVVNIDTSNAISLINCIGTIRQCNNISAIDAIIMSEQFQNAVNTISNSFYFNQQGGGAIAGSQQVAKTFFFGHLNNGQAVNATQSFEFLPNYSGPNINDTSIARFQTGVLPVAFKIDLAFQTISIGREDNPAVVNLPAGTITRSVMNFTAGASNQLNAGDLQWDGIQFFITDSLPVQSVLKKSRIFLPLGAVFAPPVDSYGMKVHCLVATRTINLPLGMNNMGDPITIKDASGTALLSPITINAPAGQTIDGALTKVINTNFGFVNLYAFNNNFFTC